MQHFGQQGAGLDRKYDLNADGKVNFPDFVIFVKNFGKTVRVDGGEISVEFPGGAKVEMVWMHPGSFIMGSSHLEPGRGNYEGPRHRVTISRGFYLGKYEITQAQWESVMGGRPWAGQLNVKEGSDHPAVYVSWEDVHEFIDRLNAAEGAVVYRLPTEAEWEYACRAGTTTRWSFGDDEGQSGDYAWFFGNGWGSGERFAHPVGTKRPNLWELYDMHGNVWEWIQDGFRQYTSYRQLDPRGPDPGRSARVIRGGDYTSLSRLMRSASRVSKAATSRSSGVGFRLVREER